MQGVPAVASGPPVERERLAAAAHRGSMRREIVLAWDFVPLGASSKKRVTA